MPLNPTDGHLIAGVLLDDHRFVGRVRTPQLFQIAPDPRETQNKKMVDSSKRLQDLLEVRKTVQRLFEGNKAKNVPKYASYIADLTRGVAGMTPPIILYSQEPLPFEVNEAGSGFLQIRWGLELVAIDGETQLAARYEAANLSEATKDEFVPIYVCHGYDQYWARQAFHDLNVLAVKPNPALSIGMDTRDPLTSVARKVEEQVAFFKNRVSKTKRQLGAADPEVTTISALRGACITLAEGIGGVKWGTRPVPISQERVPQISLVAVEWFSAITSMLAAEIEDRNKFIAGAPTVLAALGAMGHNLVHIEDASQRAAEQAKLLAKLKGVNWSKEQGTPWEGVAGAFTPKGVFSVHGTKETASSVYNALIAESTEAYPRVRNLAGVA